MDLSQIPTEDLTAFKEGRLQDIPTESLIALKGLKVQKAPATEEKTQPQTPLMQRGVNIGAAYADARSFGLGPKVASGVGSAIAKPVLEAGEAVNNLMGGDYQAPAFKDLYKKGVETYSSFGKQAFQDDPALAIGATLAGGLKTGRNIASTKAGQAAANWVSRGGLGARAVKGGLVAAPGGAIYGAGTSDLGDELAGAAKGAGLSFGLGAAAPVVGAAISKLNTKITIPNADKIKEAASVQYEKARQFGGQFKPEFTNKFLDKSRKALLSDDEIINQMKSNKPLMEAFEDLDAFRDKPMSLERAQALDEQLSNMVDGFVDAQGNISKAGRKILEAQSNFRHMIETSEDDLLEGGVQGFEALKEGRKLWSTSRRLYDIERIIDNASTYQVPATAIKTGFRRLKNSSKILGYSPEEVKAIDRAAKTGIPTDIMATFGSRLAPLVGMSQGPAGAALGYAASTASRAGATASQVSRANAAAKAVAERSGMVTQEQRLPLPTLRQILQMSPKEAKKISARNIAKTK